MSWQYKVKLFSATPQISWVILNDNIISCLKECMYAITGLNHHHLLAYPNSDWGWHGIFFSIFT